MLCRIGARNDFDDHNDNHVGGTDYNACSHNFVDHVDDGNSANRRRGRRDPA